MSTKEIKQLDLAFDEAKKLCLKDEVHTKQGFYTYSAPNPLYAAILKAEQLAKSAVAATKQPYELPDDESLIETVLFKTNCTRDQAVDVVEAFEPYFKPTNRRRLK